MGMFDNVYCKYPLPDKRHQHLEYQTKNLENLLFTYTISEEGRLIHHTTVFKAVPEEEREYYGTPEWDTNPVLRMMGSMKSTPAGDVDINYNGELYFYTIGHIKEWIEYKATFVDGTVVGIEEIKLD